MTGLKQRVARGAAWMLLLRFVERGIGVVSTIILARILVPADFGVVAMAMSVYAALEVMTAFSFDMALIQNRDATDKHYNTAWTFNVLFGLVQLVGLVALALPTAWFYSDARVGPVLMVLGVVALIRGFENIGIVQFQRDLNLVQEFKLGLARKIVGFAVTISIVLAWPSYWALIAGIIAQRVTGLLMSFVLHPYRPKFSLAAQAELLSFSKWLALNNVVLFIVHRANDFIVGRLAGPTALGAYNIAYEIANLPTTELVFPISRALFPGFSTIAHDKTHLRSIFLQVMALIAWFTIPISAGMLVLAEPLVLLLLGEKWHAAVPLIQILVVFGALRSLTSQAGNVYVVLGSPGTIMKLSTLYLVILIPCSIFATSRFGATGAAGAVVVAAALQFLVVARSLATLLSIRTVEYLAAVWRPLSGSAVLAVAVWSMDNTLVGAGASFGFRFVMGVLVGAFTYLALVGVLWHLAGRQTGTESYLLAAAAKSWRARRPT